MEQVCIHQGWTMSAESASACMWRALPWAMPRVEWQWLHEAGLRGLATILGFTWLAACSVPWLGQSLAAGRLAWRASLFAGMLSLHALVQLQVNVCSMNPSTTQHMHARVC